MNATPPPHDSDDEAIERAAIAWLCERDAGFAPGRAKAFAAWKAADARHAAAAARAEETFALVSEMPDVHREIEARVAQKAAGRDAAKAVRFPLRRALAWSSAAAAAVTLALLWPLPRSSPPEPRVLTAVAPQRALALEDGSKLDLNANTRLRVQLGKDERRIDLASGEAHFEVAPDPHRPFVVHAAGVAVRAVGTAFNVMVGPAGVEVVVTEGRVTVSHERDAAKSGAAAPLVAAGERAWIDTSAVATAPRVERLAPQRIETLLAWRKQTESFPDVALVDLVERFNRVNRTRLVISDTTLGQRRIGGTFALDEVEAFVSMLEREGDIVAERQPGDLVVLRAAR